MGLSRQVGQVKHRYVVGHVSFLTKTGRYVMSFQDKYHHGAVKRMDVFLPSVLSAGP